MAELRDDMGWSQTVLAKKLGVSLTTISDWENNKATPSLLKAGAIAQLFNVSIDYLLGLTDELFPLARENYIVIPRDAPEEYKRDLLFFQTFVDLKYPTE